MKTTKNKTKTKKNLSKWLVHLSDKRTKKDKLQEIEETGLFQLEVSVCLRSYTAGLRSWGWDDPHRKLVVGNEFESEEEFEDVLRKAKIICDAYNLAGV